MSAAFVSPVDVRPEVAAFEPYEPGLSMAEIRRRYGLARVVKMASNENPLGVPPLAQRALAEHISRSNRYPRSGNPDLVSALSSRLGVEGRCLFVGNGSDEIIDLLFRVRAVPGEHNAVAFRPCFGLYPTQARMAGVELRRADLRPDFSFDFEGLLDQVDEKTTLVFVTSPDNPSGRAAPPEELERLARALPPACLLVVDEAYTEFAGPEWSLLPRWDRLPNVALLRTFSKVYGLAGLRIGYAVLPPQLADYLWRVRLPFSLNVLAEAAAVAALEDEEFRQATLRLIASGRERLAAALAAMGCAVLPSRSNFLMFRPPAGFSAGALHQDLLKRGVIIRALGGYGLPDWLRVSVGTEEENALFLAGCREALTLRGGGKAPADGNGNGAGQEHDTGRGGSASADISGVITLDGPAGVGKSTLARRLAAELGMAYLDTGAMYRILGLRLGAQAADMPEEELRRRCSAFRFTLEADPCSSSGALRLACDGVPVGEEIRTEKAGRLASMVARLPVLREVLQHVQREMGVRWPLVAEGRDMGTRVFPDARHKFFLDARPEVRAERRWLELKARGGNPDRQAILADILARDEQDRTRAVDPLRPAPDAVLVDTSDLDLDGVLKKLLGEVRVQKNMIIRDVRLLQESDDKSGVLPPSAC